MKLQGHQEIRASREEVWTALNEAAIPQALIPGCSTLEWVADDMLDAEIEIKVGLVKARFAAKVTLSNIDPLNGYVISGEGLGGIAGHAKGQVRISLKSISKALTAMDYEAEIQITRKLTQLSARVLEGTAKKYAEQFFTNCETAVTGSMQKLDTPDAERVDALSLNQ